MSSKRKPSKAAASKLKCSSNSSKLKETASSAFALIEGNDPNGSISSNDSNSDCSIVPRKPRSVPAINMDLKKEYNRYCKLYSSEPLEFVAGPLEQATLCQGTGKTTDVGGVVIDLKGRGLRGVDCIAVGKILASNANIQHLNLSDCLLLPQGFQALLDGIAKNTSLEVLELRGNNIQSPNMLEPLGAMLKVNCRLKRLVLEWNHIGCNKEAFQHFCEGLALNSGLEYVDLRNNQVSDECTLDLAGALRHNKTLKDIDLRWNSIGVKGARSLYDLLTVNTTLTQVQLGGNFVPEEIVQHIEQMLKQRSKQEEMVKDYSTRTTILTRQLQKTEEEYQNEIKKIMNVFDAEEKEYRRIIDENQNHINRLTKEREDEVDKNVNLQKEIGNLKKKLAEASNEESKLQSIIAEKEQRLEELEKSFKSQSGSLETNFTKKVKDLQELSDRLSQEKTNLLTKLKTTEAELQVKTSEVAQLKDTIQALHKTSEQLQQQFDERLRQAKESWTGFQSEVESAERKEMQRLENQMNEMNSSLMEHLKVLENKKADAEEEVRRLKIQLVTSKSETEEELTKLRVHLAEEHNASLKSYMDQIANLRQENERLETEVGKLEGSVHKMESENGKLSRQNEHLKQQLTQANEDLSEIHANSQNVMSRTRNELKESMERLAKEEESNRVLRGQLHDLQQQVASLSVKNSKLMQEKQADLEFWKLQIQRREEELLRLKSEDMRRAALLHEAFSVYMRSTAVATGLPIPTCDTNCQSQKLLQNVLDQSASMLAKSGEKEATKASPEKSETKPSEDA